MLTMRSPLLQAQRRGRPLLVVVAGAIAATAALLLALGDSEVDGVAFTGPVARPSGLSRAGARASYLARGAAEEDDDDAVVDVEVSDVEAVEQKSSMPGEDLESVFDGERKSITFEQKRKKHVYTVNRETWMFEREDGVTGEWNRAYCMPEEEFQKLRPKYLQRYKKKARKLRRITGNQRYGNGKLVHLCKLQGSPFTREFHGEKYVGRADWVWDRGEIKRKAQKTRARELERKLRVEYEERRLERLRELGVWPGQSNWRSTVEQDVPLQKEGIRGST
eukprot:gb/GFBE01017974.1/.p1 GENE.gb/GFBE01017974.1/~~gb/GFBE01017974.1/.p1  ORF type:complete len:278 (+),score=62.52 gb/GFBE01017974.1/:1-834(+)